MFVRTFGIVSWLLGLTAAAFAQAPAPEPPGGKDPVLRLEGGGPTALVTSLAFSPDGKTLYAAGFDKVVRVWALEPGKGFALSSTSYRVPIAAGADGVINAIAVSADGTWLAAAGQGAKRGAGSFRETGLVVSRSAMPLEMRRDEGTIYVFNTRTGAVRTLRGHEGPVLSLAFDTATGKGGPFLASAAKEPGAKVDTSQTVVRLWDLGKGAGKEEVAVRKGLPDPDHVGATSQKIWVTRPGLALWPGGALVAVACDDGAFRLWDWRGDKMHVQPQPTDKFNTAVAFQPRDSRGEKCFLATTLSGREGQLQTWYVTEKDAPARFDGRVASLGEAEVPRALTLFSAGADGKRDHAALVLRAPLRGDAFSLSLIDLANYREARRVSLWGGSGDEPVVAAAPHGRYLAVAGNPDNTILIYAIKDLFGGKTRPTQTLHSDGETMRYVGFVTQGKDKPGLLLNTRDEADGGMSRPRAPGKKGDVVFDFAARAVTDKLGGWKSDAPDLAEWDVIKTDGKSTTLHVEKKKARQGPEVTLEPGQEVTAYALLPAGPPPLKGALLAVAINDGGVISVALYDVTTGRQVRQCTGPTTFVRSLAFSADGRLLAAAADDQTVSVWTLTNLAEIVGQHGLIRGLFVKDDARGRPVVDGVKGLDDKTIRPGDVVEGLVVDGKLTKPTDSAQQFYRAVWEIAPARQKTVTVRVGGRDVTLGVGQGVDERKPLLSLFVTAADKAGRREWVGWSPVGPYDAGSRETERLVGWHVNTGATDRPPARLALAEQYKDNYKPGILQKLAEYANVGRAIEAWRPPQEGPPPDPNMKPGLEEDGRALTPEGGNHFRVGRRRVAMTLTLDGFPADKIGSLDWEAFGKRESLTDHGNHKWTANLSELPWQRGEHTINVRLRTKGANPREYTAALVVRYQPTAPRLAEARTHPVATDKDPYPVKLHVIPTADGEPVHVTLFRKGDDKPLLDLQGISKPQDVGKDVPLAGEENLIQAVAENEGAPAGAAGEAERARWDVRVTYNVPRPQIALKQIVLPDGSALRIDPDHPEKVLPVDVPTFNVKGEVAALADLVGAEWVQDKGEAKALAGFDPASPKKKLPIDQPVTLSAPGVPVVLTFRARSAKAEKWEERRFTVEYRPRLPVATMAGPANGEIFYEGEEPDPRRVPVVVTLQWPPTDAHPCQARLVVNGKAQGEPQTLKKDATRYQGQALLEPGPNTVEVRLSNDWRKEQKDQAVVGPVTVYYRRPPVVSMKPGMTANKPPRVRVDAEVVSPAGPPLRAEFRVTPLRKDGLRPTGDTEKTVVVRAADMKKGDKGTVWTFGADLPLDAGDNEISLVAFNKDGVSRKPAVAKVTYTSPPPPRPTARFTDPADNANTVSANYKVRFIVTSDSPLTKVQLRRDRDEVLFEATAAALRAAPRDGPGFRYEAEAPVKLDRGPNKLCAVTANADGGEDVTPYVIINYHYRPAVRVTIEALEVGGERLPPEGEPREGILSFPPAAAGRVAVRGRVSCDKDHAEALAKLTRLDVTVNGYHQLPARLDDAPPGALSRAFRLPDILLDREKGNDIDVLPPVADPPFVVTADSRARCTVDCKDRVKSLRRRLHLLAIDLDGTRDQAIKGALAAVVGSDLKGDQFKVPYCDVGGRLYGPLTGADVTPSTVTAQLAAIKDRLRENAEGGAVHDVVMVYYRGDVVRIGGVQYFQTSMSRPLPKPRPPTMVCCDELERFFGETQGAHLVFLDVTEAPVAAAAQPGGGTDLVSARREPHVAILRYTWSGGAGPQPPTAPHVLTDLGTAMAKSGRLEDVQDKVAAGFAKAGLDKQPLPSRLFPENSWLSYWLPAEMRALPFGATARAP